MTPPASGTSSVLVVSTVHHPDDARIREKLIRTLARRAAVTFAARDPGPSDSGGLTWVRLPGGRLRRNLEAWRLVFANDWSVVSLHDPELLPLGIVAAWRGRKVVFDVHEDIPHQIRMRAWIPRLLRPPLAAASAGLLRLAERTHAITLAEPTYGHRFRHSHPVIPNYLPAHLPPARDERDGSIVYLGDVTVERGILELIDAAAGAGRPLVVIGAIDPRLSARLQRRAADAGTELRLLGRLPHRHALEAAASSSVGVSPLRDLPNYRDSLPTKVLEYLAMGLPVVATDLPATRRVLEGWKAVWLVPPGDVEALAAAITEAVRASGHAIEQAAMVRERYGWPVDLVESVYFPE